MLRQIGLDPGQEGVVETVLRLDGEQLEPRRDAVETREVRVQVRSRAQAGLDVEVTAASGGEPLLHVGGGVDERSAQGSLHNLCIGSAGGSPDPKGKNW